MNSITVLLSNDNGISIYSSITIAHLKTAFRDRHRNRKTQRAQGEIEEAADQHIASLQHNAIC